MRVCSGDRPVYQNMISVLQNPFYAGAYAYGKTPCMAKIVDGRAQDLRSVAADRRLDRARTRPSRGVHHVAAVSAQPRTSPRNCFRKPAGASKAARGGAALLGGLLRCRRCGRLLGVTYGGRGVPRPRYSCRRGHWMNGAAPCITFGAARPDAAIAQAILVVVQPLAVEAAVVAEHERVTRARSGGAPSGWSASRPPMRSSSPSGATSRWIPTTASSRRSSSRAGTRRWRSCARARLASGCPHGPPAAPDRARLLSLAAISRRRGARRRPR